MIETERLKLVAWQDRHLDAFAEMHADAQVMADLGGPIDMCESRRKLDRYREAFREYGVARWAVEDRDGAFLGYAGVMPRMSPGHPLGEHFEIGWRFVRSAWGNGYATESARASLDHAVDTLGLADILAYTSAENLRSQSVMKKLGMVRCPKRDFVQEIAHGAQWHGLVWRVVS
ncbi:GNAT family N-acetyltransferase [Nisaea sediminum]|uniref:GNAT family N-acetyltransferase n=1 Tax=Nisaea sediminum TaxID=2775867 RepID=UPI00186617E5|nr:GNAT family N-acetyltransferase [Nisaea sediminum]